jgi:CheY-like chemotaxis protein
MERGGWWTPRAPEEWDGAVVRLLPIRVLVVSSDPAFRAASATLIARRGSIVEIAAGEDDAADVAARARTDVLLYDLTGRRVPARRHDAPGGVAAICARILAHTGPTTAGLVLVGEPREEADPPIEGVPVLNRWVRFEELFAAIVEADRRRQPAHPVPVGPVRRPFAV